MNQTVDILETYLSELDIDQVISSSEISGGDTLISVPKNFYARKGLAVTVNGIDYTIKDVDSNGNIVIDPEVADLRGKILTLQSLFYFHGTPIMQNEEFSYISDTQNKSPMLYVIEPISDISENDPESRIDRESTCVICFLDDANFKDWTTDDYYDEAINGMREFAEYFVDQMKNDGKFGLIRNVTYLNRAKFGIYTENKGAVRNILDEHLSGVEVRLTIPVNKIFNCSYD